MESKMDQELFALEMESLTSQLETETRGNTGNFTQRFLGSSMQQDYTTTKDWFYIWTWWYGIYIIWNWECPSYFHNEKF